MDDEPVACLPDTAEDRLPAALPDCLEYVPAVPLCALVCPDCRTTLPMAPLMPDVEPCVLEPDDAPMVLSDMEVRLTELNVLPETLLAEPDDCCAVPEDALPETLLAALADAEPAVRLTEPEPAFDTDWAVPAADLLAPLDICAPVPLRTLLESTPIPSL